MPRSGLKTRASKNNNNTTSEPRLAASSDVSGHPKGHPFKPVLKALQKVFATLGTSKSTPHTGVAGNFISLTGTATPAAHRLFAVQE